MPTQAARPAPTSDEPHRRRPATGRTPVAPAAGVCTLIGRAASVTASLRRHVAPPDLLRWVVLAALAHAGEQVLRVLGGPADYEAIAAHAPLLPPADSSAGDAHQPLSTDGPAQRPQPHAGGRRANSH